MKQATGKGKAYSVDLMKTASSRVSFPIVTATHFMSNLELNFHNCLLFGCDAVAAAAAAAGFEFASHRYYNSLLQPNGAEVHIKKELFICK